MRKLTEWALIAFFVYMAVGCGGGGGGKSGGGGSGTDVTVSPPSSSGTLGDTVNFSAQIGGASSTAVNWSVQEGAAGGSITSAGAYTAPKTPGIFHIVATNQADTSKTGVATIVVRSGSGTINVQ